MSRSGGLHLFVLIDGMGWSLIEGRGFLADLLPYRTPLSTVLGFSSGAIPTLLTGVPPAQNGHWNLFYYDPAGSPFRWLRHARFLPESFLANRVTRRVVKEMGRRILGLGPLFECCVSPQYLPFFNWVEKDNIYKPGGIKGAASIFDQLTAQHIPYKSYSYHDGTDAQILRRLEQDLAKREVSFFFVYLCELDGFLHANYGDSSRVDEKVEWHGTSLRRVYEAARRVEPEATLTITSDHGMTPVRHHIDLVAQVKRLGFSMPDDYLAVYDSTMARFWFFHEPARREMTAYLDEQRCGRMLSDGELHHLGVLFPDRRFGEVIFLLDPGYLIAKSDFHGAGWMPVGMHGYHPEDPDSDAVLLSNKPLSVRAKTIVDVHRCMHAAAGLDDAVETRRAL